MKKCGSVDVDKFHDRIVMSPAEKEGNFLSNKLLLLPIKIEDRYLWYAVGYVSMFVRQIKGN